MTWLGPLIAAPFIGSFLGVLIVRLPEGRPVAWTRSACNACGRALGARDLVPLLSYAVLGGKCRTCRAPIAKFHPAVELAAIGVAAWAAVAEPDPAGLWADCVLGWTLLALGWIDAGHRRLPDALTLPLVLLGLTATLWLDPEAATDHALAAALGYLVFRAIAVSYRALRGREGLGGGDAKLLAAAGAWVGLAGLPNVVLLAGLGGLGGAALLWARGRAISRQTAVAFGPYLAAATWLVRLYGPF